MSESESARRIGELYEPVKMELLPGTELISTRDPGRYDQIKVVLAVYNDLKDRDRGFGTFQFEARQYRKAEADRRGERWGFWEIPVTTPEELAKYWDPILRMYEFRLDCQNTIPQLKKAVLEVTLQCVSGRRLHVVKEMEIPRPVGLSTGD